MGILMRWLRIVVSVFALLLLPLELIAAELVVITQRQASDSTLDDHKPALALNREQVRNLYMGASLSYELKPIALKPGNRTRSLFNAKVIGLSESRIQSYWAQMKFTGRMKAPKTLASENAVLEYLLQNPGSVGYVAADTELPTSIQVIFRTGDQ